MELAWIADQFLKGAVGGLRVVPERIKDLLLPVPGPKVEATGQFPPPLFFGGDGLPPSSDQAAIDADIPKQAVTLAGKLLLAQ